MRDRLTETVVAPQTTPITATPPRGSLLALYCTRLTSPQSAFLAPRARRLFGLIHMQMQIHVHSPSSVQLPTRNSQGTWYFGFEPSIMSSEAWRISTSLALRSACYSFCPSGPSRVVASSALSLPSPFPSILSSLFVWPPSFCTLLQGQK